MRVRPFYIRTTALGFGALAVLIAGVVALVHVDAEARHDWRAARCRVEACSAGSRARVVSLETAPDARICAVDPSPTRAPCDPDGDDDVATRTYVTCRVPADEAHWIGAHECGRRALAVWPNRVAYLGRDAARGIAEALDGQRNAAVILTAGGASGLFVAGVSLCYACYWHACSTFAGALVSKARTYRRRQRHAVWRPGRRGASGSDTSDEEGRGQAPRGQAPGPPFGRASPA